MIHHHLTVTNQITHLGSQREQIRRTQPYTLGKKETSPNPETSSHQTVASNAWHPHQDDPISAALKPSPMEASVSSQIDDDLREERERLEKKKGDVKLLLLGQAESGKSTLPKQFQLMYKPTSMDQERASWTAVIYFNVVRSLKHILATLEAWDDTLDEDAEAQPTSTDDSQSIIPKKARGNGIADQPSPSTSLLTGSIIQGSPSSLMPSEAGGSHSHSMKEGGALQIANLRRRLSPLVAADAQLADRLSGGISVSGSGKGGVFVRSGWQARTIENALGKIKQKCPSAESEKKTREIEPQEPQDPLDIRELWHHPTVKGLIAKRKRKLDEWSEFFLKNITRVASPDYVPSIDDILHARIQTMGVAEHIFDVNIHGKSVTWHLFDVGGARGQRHSWVPYFDDTNAIIFVAPNVHLVLFLNKTDLLKAKLDTGLKVRKYIMSFGDRSNDYETVVQYFRAHFLQVHRRNNENRQVLYTHFTSVVDTKATQRIIGNVRDSIFRGYLQSAALV
ncbi:guanine nucleotide-binding protein alpha-4 subunit [Laccaria bicolor S238N-H82]|uniref:Guanine nucleotide-binding protein alpha-4 subunit n=1 Tax=Laccaria bicolor (strain S238N-H82 / ATCC MYA-4686) TaxID=486041 RepID=B0DWH5_LACBS|nr:guanine nucleotide-binding protein alpha-4 subunit [Laccaria bicolor S238N-H82]EDR01047.1 guanine nucleotide-binding protein alpha-4 subunit [Laccaria bicolor S238N-H82]|eukprot:XP_001888266.1 guanine nucleotide-binding protein alpha-4 subunit [Laccaria bicolor S238N-H82]